MSTNSREVMQDERRRSEVSTRRGSQRCRTGGRKYPVGAFGKVTGRTSTSMAMVIMMDRNVRAQKRVGDSAERLGPWQPLEKSMKNQELYRESNNERVVLLGGHAVPLPTLLSTHTQVGN